MNDAAVTCSACGRVAAADEQVTTEWMTEVDPRRGLVQICGDCARRHVRAIEARLDQEWW